LTYFPAFCRREPFPQPPGFRPFSNGASAKDRSPGTAGRTLPEPDVQVIPLRIRGRSVLPFRFRRFSAAFLAENFCPAKKRRQMPPLSK